MSPDIAMCLNKKCPSNKKCHRFTAPPCGWQSYMEFKPKKGEDKCESFWDNADYGYMKKGKKGE